MNLSNQDQRLIAAAITLTVALVASGEEGAKALGHLQKVNPRAAQAISGAVGLLTLGETDMGEEAFDRNLRRLAKIGEGFITAQLRLEGEDV